MSRAQKLFHKDMHLPRSTDYQQYYDKEIYVEAVSTFAAERRWFRGHLVAIDDERIHIHVYSCFNVNMGREFQMPLNRVEVKSIRLAGEYIYDDLIIRR